MISSLRQNSLEVLVSPRVRTIPRSYRVTVMTHIFIILVSLTAALTYTYLSTATTCQARPLGPDLNQEQFTCDGLKVRREFVGQLDITNSSLGISFLIIQNVELQLEIVAPEFISTEFSEFAVSAEILGTISETLIRMLGISPTLGTSLLDQTYFSFTQLLLADLGTVPGLDIRLVPQGSVADVDLTLFTSNKPPTLPANDPSINITQDEYTLVMAFATEGQMNCILTMDFDAMSPESQLIAACFSTEVVGNNIPVLRFSFVGQQTFDTYQAAESMLLYFQNLHGELFSDDDGAFGIMESIFATNFFFCCFPDRLDEVEFFGIFSGIGFLLEGIFTFLFVLVLFRGRISEAEAKKEENKRHSFAYELQEGVVEEISFKEAILEDKLLEKRSVRAVRGRDIIRVVFNPRCRYIPYASVISFLSLVVLIGLSAMLAIWYQNLRTIRVCEPTPVNDLSASTPNCESLSVTNVFYPRITFGANSLSLQVTATVTVDEDKVTSLDPNEIFNQVVVDAFSGCTLQTIQACTPGAAVAIQSAFPEASVFNETRLENGVEEWQFTMNRFIPVGDEDQSLDVFIIARKGSGGGGAGVIGFNASDANIKDFELRWTYRSTENPGPGGFTPGFIPKTIIEYSASFKSNFVGQERVLDPFDNGGDLAKGLIESMGSLGGASDLIVKPVGDTFVQCCGLSSLAYYDYLGLMMGYVAMFEGLLTFLCAFVLYELFRGCNKLRRQ